MDIKLPSDEILLMTASIKVGNTPYVKIDNEKEKLS